MKSETCLNTDLYCITAEKLSRGRSNIQVVREMLAAGIRIIQYREKEKSMMARYQECEEIRKLTREYGATFIINDHVDLALAVEADGVHIGQEDLPIEVVRSLAGDELLIGVSTHSPEEAEDAVRRGADYIAIGPIFRTTTKENAGEPVGLEYLEYVAKNVDIPLVAIGGITEENILDVYRAGARCISLVSEIVGAEDIGAKIASLRRKLGMATE
ncbi:MAG: thiamine phosphate synthase [Halanaerobiales bacterium]|jgi:thiamine-phosphate pyrophosphorylase|nr:thiamine phosphate synthase [Bacillota bacterium]